MFTVVVDSPSTSRSPPSASLESDFGGKFKSFCGSSSGIGISLNFSRPSFFPLSMTTACGKFGFGGNSGFGGAGLWKRGFGAVGGQGGNLGFGFMGGS